ncbi:MAG: hypothetical protein NDJ90_10670 [Oligoflexia bacterium]|nr:hypothetical protein [Oligoflexia bacterium]
MRSIWTLVLLSLASTNAFATVNLRSFSEWNFAPIRANHCGIHLEVSGSTVIFTNILPPNRDFDQCGEWSICNGSSEAIECDEQGRCMASDGDLFLLLMENGDILFLNSGTKFRRYNRGNFQYC